MMINEDYLNRDHISEAVHEILKRELKPKTAICITIPRDITWREYEEELAAVADGSQEMLFRLPGYPRKVAKGDRCYICHRGFIIGWMTIMGIEESPSGFTCTTTGKHWPAGIYLKRSGEFHYLRAKVPMHGFQGFRYIEEID